MKIEMVADPEPEPEPKPTEEVPPAGEGFERRYFVSEMRSLKNGDIEAYVSTESVDRMGDVIKASGWELDNFRKTGAPVLFGHDYSQPPIGNAIELQVQGKKLWSVTRFHEKTQKSKEAAILAREGIMRSWSVGFNPLERPKARTDPDGVFLGLVFSKQELLEYSLVSVPANPDAVSKDALSHLLEMAKKGVISRSTAAYVAGPSPLAVADSAESGVRMPVNQNGEVMDEHLAKMAGLFFLKRIAS